MPEVINQIEDPNSLEQLEKGLEEEMAGLIGGKGPFDSQIPSAPATSTPSVDCGVVATPSLPPIGALVTPAPSPTPAPGLPETVPGEVVPPVALDHPASSAPITPIATLSGPGPTDAVVPPVPGASDVGGLPPVVPPVVPDDITKEAPPEGNPLMEKKTKKDNLKQVKQAGAVTDRADNKHMPPAKKVEKVKTKYDRKKEDWKKFDESVNAYITKTSRNCDIGVNSLEKIWKECVESQEKSKTHPRSTRSFWLEVRSNFDRKINEIFLQEAKKKMTERQKMNASIESFLEHVAKDKYVEAKAIVKEMVGSCVNSMISERKVQYQKNLAEEIAKKVREAK